MADNSHALSSAEMHSTSVKGLTTMLWRRAVAKLPLMRKGGAAIADQGLFAGSNFLINVLLARFLLPVEYGAFATAYAIFLLMGSLYIAVLIEPMLVFGSGKYGERWPRYLGIVMYGHWILSLLLGVPLIMLAYVFQQQGSGIMAEAMLGLCAAQPFILMNWVLRRAFYVISKPHQAASGGFVYLLLMVGGTFAAFYAGVLSSFIALIIIAVASLITSIWFLVLLEPVLLRQPDDDTTPVQVIKDHLHYGKWSAPTMLLTWIPSNIYYTVLPLLVGLAGSGALKASMNLIMPILHANTAISVLLAPSFVRALKYGGKQKLRQRTNLGLMIFTVTCGIYWIILMLYGNQLIDWIYAGQYSDAVHFGILFVMGLIPLTNGIGEIISGSLRAIGKLDYILWTHVVSGGFTLTVSIGLLYLWGTSGAYVGLFLASAVAATLAYFLYRRGLSQLKRDRIDELHSFDSTEAAVAASMRADFVQARQAQQAQSEGISGESDESVVVVTNRMNLMVVDYDATPDNPDSSWPLFLKYADQHHVWVILGKSQYAACEAYAATHPMSPRLHFIFYDLPFARELQAVSQSIYQFLWQVGLFFLVKHLNGKHNFDVVHQMTRGMYVLPSFLPFLKPPVLLGPLHGSVDIPPALRAGMSRASKWGVIVRRFLRGLAQYNPLLRLSLQRVAKAYAADFETAQDLKRLGAASVAVVPAHAIPEAQVQQLHTLQPSAPASDQDIFRFLSSSTLDGHSGMAFILRAFQQVLTTRPHAQLWIYGTGSERDDLQKMAHDLGIEHRVWFRGTLTADEWEVALAECQAVIDLQLRGDTNAQLLEAIAAGRPTLVLQHGAKRLWANGDTSVVLDPMPVDELIPRLRDDLLRLATRQDDSEKRTEKAYQYLQQYMVWERKADEYARDYSAELHRVQSQSIVIHSLQGAGD